MDEMPETVTIMRDQAVKLMALHTMVRDGELTLRRNAFRNDADAENALADVAQEIALQMGGLGRVG